MVLQDVYDLANIIFDFFDIVGNFDFSFDEVRVLNQLRHTLVEEVKHVEKVRKQRNLLDVLVIRNHTILFHVKPLKNLLHIVNDLDLHVLGYLNASDGKMGVDYFFYHLSEVRLGEIPLFVVVYHVKGQL